MQYQPCFTLTVLPGNFERMMRERGHERELPPGIRSGAFDAERPRFDPNEDVNRRRERESERLV